MAKNVLVGAVLIIILLIGALLAVGYGPFAREEAPKDDAANIDLTQIKSFEDCEAAGFPVMESYPRQCATPDGRTFVEEIEVEATYVNTTPDKIMVELPFPGAVVGKEFTVVGTSSGWYFEGSFPVEVRDSDNNILVQTYATAQADWMTSEPVGFISNVVIPKSYIGPATLILRKDNPSGLPENDASMSFPITIEY